MGYNSIKQAWFTGLKVHILTTYRGHPKEFLITHGSIHDLTAFEKMYLGTVPQRSTIFTDKSYTSQQLEERLLLSKDILLLAKRRANSKKGQSMIYQRYERKIRKRIETAFSRLISWLPRRIHAVNNQGFVLKLMLLITAFSFSFFI